jgi:hypothetical protein
MHNIISSKKGLGILDGGAKIRHYLRFVRTIQWHLTARSRIVMRSCLLPTLHPAGVQGSAQRTGLLHDRWYGFCHAKTERGCQAFQLVLATHAMFLSFCLRVEWLRRAGARFPTRLQICHAQTKQVMLQTTNETTASVLLPYHLHVPSAFRDSD